MRKIGVYNRTKAVDSRLNIPWSAGLDLALLILVILLLL